MSLFFTMGILSLTTNPLPADSGDIWIGPYPKPSKPVPPKNDPLTLYKEKVYVAVGSRWYPSISQVVTTLEQGKVHLKFAIHSDGSLSDIVVLEGKDLKHLLAVSIDALESAAPFDFFDKGLIKQVGNKYSDDFTFQSLPK